jgi:hypothetical protein
VGKAIIEYLEFIVTSSFFGKFNSMRRVPDELIDLQVILKSLLLARDQLQLNAVSNHAVYRVINELTQPVVQQILILSAAFPTIQLLNSRMPNSVNNGIPNNLYHDSDYGD